MKRAQVNSLLHGRKIVIASQANYGNGEEYRFKVTDGGTVARFDHMQLMVAGYKVEPVGDCMVKISGYQETFFAMCEESKSDGVLASALGVAKETTSM